MQWMMEEAEVTSAQGNGWEEAWRAELRLRADGAQMEEAASSCGKRGLYRTL